MSIPLSLSDVVYGVVVPTVVAVLVVWLWRRKVKAEAGQQFGDVLAFVAGFHAGYWLLGLGPARPESHWQWLPWLLLLTLTGGVPLFANRSAFGARAGLTVVIAAVAGWLLVPTWDHLEPSRMAHVAVFTSAMVLVALALQPLTIRVPPVWLLVNLGGVLAAAGAILGLSGSLRFAQIAGCGAAALTGLAIAAKFEKQRVRGDGLATSFALLVAGLMLIGRVNSFSDVPLVSYVLPPLAPLSLWLATSDRLGGAGMRRWLLLLLPLLVCGIAVGLAVASEFPNEDSW